MRWIPSRIEPLVVTVQTEGQTGPVLAGLALEVAFPNARHGRERTA